ncbi:MAG: flavodoxin family protein [Clostridia bacterium]
MKVLILNGSSHLKGCTYTALEEIGKTLNENGVEYEIFQIGSKTIRDCIACGKCSGNGCIFSDDLVNEFCKKAKEADAFVFGTPVYYAHPSGRILSFLDRCFYSSKSAFEFKPGCAIASARRAGTVASFDVLNKYFTICSMPVVSANYWNNVHGSNSDEVVKDLEGMQIMRNLGTNMSWLLKCIDCGKNAGIDTPKTESTYRTNFIR